MGGIHAACISLNRTGVSGGKKQETTYACTAPKTKGAIRLLSLSLIPGCLLPTLDSLIPMAPASPIPPPARSRLNTQQETVTIFLRQCCSPSVRLTLADVASTARRAAKIPILRMRPIVPFWCSSAYCRSRYVGIHATQDVRGRYRVLRCR